MSDVTRILDCVQPGEAKAGEDLLPLVYDELRTRMQVMNIVGAGLAINGALVVGQLGRQR